MINLTIPLYPYISSGNVFPWDSPYRTEEIATYERNAARLFYISMGSDTGTRLMAPSLVNAGGPTICDIAASDLLNRKATILRIPKEMGEAISSQNIESALKMSPELMKGDALVVVTGWGNNKRWKKKGEDYVLQTPYFSTEGAKFLATYMQDKKVNLLLTDCALLDGIAACGQYDDWLKQPSWVRNPYPSEPSQAYIRWLDPQKAQLDFPATHSLLRNNWAIVGLACADQLKSDRVILNCLPLNIQNAGEAPCTVVAEQL